MLSFFFFSFFYGKWNYNWEVKLISGGLIIGSLGSIYSLLLVIVGTAIEYEQRCFVCVTIFNYVI